MSPERHQIDPDQSPEEIERSMKRETEGLLELEDLDMPEPPQELANELTDAETAQQPHAADRRSARPRARQR